MSIYCEIYHRKMPLELTDDYSTSIQVMTWCRQATSHYLSQCWSSFMSPYNITSPRWVNSCPSFPYRWYASWLELFRCVVYLAVDFALSSKTSELDSSNLLYIPRCIFMFSLSLWIVHYSKTDEKATKVE